MNLIRYLPAFLILLLFLCPLPILYVIPPLAGLKTFHFRSIMYLSNLKSRCHLEHAQCMAFAQGINANFISIHTISEPLPMAHPPPWNQGWWQEHFLDHPGYSSWSQDAFANPLACGDKFKVWCKLCFAVYIRDEQAQDDAEVASGLHPSC